MARTFWNRLSQLYNHLPAPQRKFVEYTWDGFGRIAAQWTFETHNAVGTFALPYLPIYYLQYWREYIPTAVVPADVWAIPTLQDQIFDDVREFVAGVDYSLVNHQITWTVLGPTDADMSAGDTTAWTPVGSPATVEKNNGLHVVGAAGDGVQSSAIALGADTHVRVHVTTADTVTVQLRTGTTVVAETSGAGPVNLTWETPTAQSVTIVIRLPADGEYTLTGVRLTPYPRAERVFAPETQRYNPYLETAWGTKLDFEGVNDGQYSPKHANYICRVLHAAYLQGNTPRALISGVTAVLGLPFAYEAGEIAAKTTTGAVHRITLTLTDGTSLTQEISTTVCDLDDLLAVGTAVEQYEPLLADALKLRRQRIPAQQPQTALGYPASWTASGNATVIPGAETQVTTTATGEGARAATLAVTAANRYRVTGVVRAVEAIAEVRIHDLTHDTIIARQWYGDTTAEPVALEWTVPIGCTQIRLEVVTLVAGTFYISEFASVQLFAHRGYHAEILTSATRATLTLTDRAGTDLVFTAGDQCAGTDGNYLQVAITASGANQPLSSTLVGSGTAGDPYVYTITTGTEATQNSNDAIVAYVNADPLVMHLVSASATADATADPTYTLPATALTGGENGTIGLYASTPVTVDTQVRVRNLTQGSQELITVAAITGAQGDYQQVFHVKRNLIASYNGNDHIIIDQARLDHEWSTGVVLYNRWPTTYAVSNIERFLERIRDQGYSVTFKDVAP